MRGNRVGFREAPPSGRMDRGMDHAIVAQPLAPCRHSSEEEPEPFRFRPGISGHFGAVYGCGVFGLTMPKTLASQGFWSTCAPHWPSSESGFESPPLRS